MTANDALFYIFILTCGGIAAVMLFAVFLKFIFGSLRGLTGFGYAQPYPYAAPPPPSPARRRRVNSGGDTSNGPFVIGVSIIIGILLLYFLVTITEYGPLAANELTPVEDTNLLRDEKQILTVPESESQVPAPQAPGKQEKKQAEPRPQPETPTDIVYAGMRPAAEPQAEDKQKISREVFEPVRDYDPRTKFVYGLQNGAFERAEGASKRAEQLLRQGHSVGVYLNRKQQYCVTILGFQDSVETREYQERYQLKGFPAVLSEYSSQILVLP